MFLFSVCLCVQIPSDSPLNINTFYRIHQFLSVLRNSFFSFIDGITTLLCNEKKIHSSIKFKNNQKVFGGIPSIIMCLDDIDSLSILCFAKNFCMCEPISSL